MHNPDQRCTDLIEVTANALSGGVVALMLIAVQRDNLELSIKQAITRCVLISSKIVVKVCSPIIGPIVFLKGGLEIWKP